MDLTAYTIPSPFWFETSLRSFSATRTSSSVLPPRDLASLRINFSLGKC